MALRGHKRGRGAGVFGRKALDRQRGDYDASGLGERAPGGGDGDGLFNRLALVYSVKATTSVWLNEEGAEAPVLLGRFSPEKAREFCKFMNECPRSGASYTYTDRAKGKGAKSEATT